MKPAKSAYAPTGGEHGEWLGDVVYVGNTQGSTAHRIFTVMGVNSRYVYARALTKATAAGPECDGNVGGGRCANSRRAAETARHIAHEGTALMLA